MAWSASSGMSSPAARTSKVFARYAIARRPPIIPPPRSARTSSSVKCPGVRSMRPVRRETFWPQITASSRAAAPEPVTPSEGLPTIGKLPVRRPSIG